MPKKVYINPGHSDTDPGAVGYEVERQLAVKVSIYQRDYLLQNYDVDVRMNPGTMGNLYEICKDANAWGAELFVSNHFNAGKGDGYEALVYSEKRRALGEIFEKHVKAVGQNSRGVKLRPGLVVLRDTNMPAVLNEGAFVDNLKDIQDWNEDHELKKLGEAYAKAAAEYMMLDKLTVGDIPDVVVKDLLVQVSLPVLKKGAEGDAVRALQKLLGITANGIFSRQTDSAVRNFQNKHGLVVDGIVGEQTWKKLLGLQGELI